MRRPFLTLIVATGMLIVLDRSLSAQKKSTTVTLTDAHGQSVGTAVLSADITGGVAYGEGDGDEPEGHACGGDPLNLHWWRNGPHHSREG
jgi:hypothetical protein